MQVIITLFFKNFDAELIPDKKFKMYWSKTVGPEDDELLLVTKI